MPDGRVHPSLTTTMPHALVNINTAAAWRVPGPGNSEAAVLFGRQSRPVGSRNRRAVAAGTGSTRRLYKLSCAMDVNGLS